MTSKAQYDIAHSGLLGAMSMLVKEMPVGAFAFLCDARDVLMLINDGTPLESVEVYIDEAMEYLEKKNSIQAYLKVRTALAFLRSSYPRARDE